jgi:hypothetical protein
VSRRARVGAVAVVALAVLALVLGWLRARRTTLEPPWLAVYEAIGQDLLLLGPPVDGAGARRRLGCLHLPRWAVRVGEKDDRLLLLDPTAASPSLLAVDLERLRRIVAGRATCDDAHPPLVRVALHANKVPYRGLIDGDTIWVSYFGERFVERYRWHARHSPPVAYDGALPLPGDDLGLSDLALVGDTLAVAASGYRCYGANCPRGHFAPGRVFLVDRATAAARVVLPENVNSAGLYRHLDGATFVISAGDYAGGHGSVQRLGADGTLGRAIRLPPGSAAGSARALDRDHFVVLQMSGEHLFVIDAAADALTRVLRFDGERFVAVDAAAALPDRATADFQDLVADGAVPDRFFVVDSKGERLLVVRWHAADAALTVEHVVPLGDARFRVSPNWALWLR